MNIEFKVYKKILSDTQSVKSIVKRLIYKNDCFSLEVLAINSISDRISTDLCAFISEVEDGPSANLKLNIYEPRFSNKVWDAFNLITTKSFDGVSPLLTCMTLLKFYRKAYFELLSNNVNNEIGEIINYYFDMSELTCCERYLQNIQSKPESLTILKNRLKSALKDQEYLVAILECINFPIFHVTDDGFIQKANYQGYQLFPESIINSVKSKSWLSSLQDNKFEVSQLIEKYDKLYHQFIEENDDKHRVKIKGVYYECYFSRVIQGAEDECKTILFLIDNSSEIESEKALETERNQRLFEQQEIISILGEILESRSGETGLHVQRVSYVAAHLAKLYGLPKNEIEVIKTISPLHDVGKIGIPDSILNKPGSLSSEEFNLIKTHTTIGYNILKNSKSKLTKLAATVSYEHHERWDGSGYPNAKSGKQIHIYARIVAIADVFDALLSKRPYKEAWEKSAVLALFKKESGKHFDPYLAQVFIDHFDEFITLHAQFQQTDSSNDFHYGLAKDFLQ